MLWVKVITVSSLNYMHMKTIVSFMKWLSLTPNKWKYILPKKTLVDLTLALNWCGNLIGNFSLQIFFISSFFISGVNFINVKRAIFFVRALFLAAFSSYMYVSKMMFVQKISSTLNVRIFCTNIILETYM